MVVLDPHHPHSAPDPHQAPRQLEAEAEVLEVGALHAHVLLHHVAPQPQLDDGGLHVVLQHVVLRVNDGGDVEEDRIGGPVQLCQLQSLHAIKDLLSLCKLCFLASGHLVSKLVKILARWMLSIFNPQL